MKKDLQDIERRLVDLEIEKSKLQADLCNALERINISNGEKKKNEKKLEVGSIVLFCSKSGSQNFNKKGKVVSITMKCVWITEEGSIHKIRRHKTSVKLI